MASSLKAFVAQRPLLRKRFDRRGMGRHYPDGWNRKLWDLMPSVPRLRPVLPLEIRYDAAEEVPILTRRPRLFFLDFAVGAPGLLHCNLNKYWVGDSLQEIYAHIVTEHQGMDAGAAGKEVFGRDMQTTLKTFEKYGSCVCYDFGTCCTRDEDGALSVVVDEGLDVAVGALPHSRMQCTGYVLWTVSKRAFESGAYRVQAERPRKSMDYEYVVPDAAEKQLTDSDVNVKVAVEIDRSVIGRGKLVLFMPPAAAWNKFEVFAEMSKAGDDVSGIQLTMSTPPAIQGKLKHPATYTMCLIDLRDGYESYFTRASDEDEDDDPDADPDE